MKEKMENSWHSDTEQLETEYKETLAYTQVLEQEIDRYKQNEAELEQRSTQLALINGIAREITAIVELDEMLDRTAYLIHQMFGYHHVALYVLNGNSANLKACAGIHEDSLSNDYNVKLTEGIVGQVATYGERVVANDVALEPDYLPIDAEIDMRSELCLPIKMAAGNTLGVLDIRCLQANAFNQNDIAAMETLVSQIAVVIEKTHLYEAIQQELSERKRAEAELKTRAHQQAVVADLGQRVLAGIKLSTLLKDAATLVVEVLDIEYCQILELMPDADQLLLKAGVGWQAERIGETTVSADTKYQTGYTLLSSGHCRRHIDRNPF